MTATATQPRQLVTGGDPEVLYPVPPFASFIEPESDTEQDYIAAPDLEDVGRAIIASDAGMVITLASVRLVFLWKREGGKDKGRHKFGQCQKPGALWRHLANVDAVIWLAADHLRGRTALTVHACLDHELRHLGLSDSGALTIVGHDLEEHQETIRRYGVDWLPDRASFARAVQMAMPLGS